jgi:hypothetical protein
MVCYSGLRRGRQGGPQGGGESVWPAGRMEAVAESVGGDGGMEGAPALWLARLRRRHSP